jgi:hypothetical protein
MVEQANGADPLFPRFVGALKTSDMDVPSFAYVADAKEGAATVDDAPNTVMNRDESAT